MIISVFERILIIWSWFFILSLSIRVLYRRNSAPSAHFRHNDGRNAVQRHSRACKCEPGAKNASRTTPKGEQPPGPGQPAHNSKTTAATCTEPGLDLHNPLLAATKLALRTLIIESMYILSVKWISDFFVSSYYYKLTYCIFDYVLT